MGTQLVQWPLCVAICAATWLSGQAQESALPESPGPLSEILERWQHEPRGSELPLAELELDPGAHQRKRVGRDAAAIDVERFFYLLERGYCGYGYFARENDFESARVKILEELRTREHWPTRDLAELMRSHLDFITDCHLKLGHVQFAGHLDFWFSPDLMLAERDGVYYVGSPDEGLVVTAIDGKDPEQFVFRSLDTSGLPSLTLGTLSRRPPAASDQKWGHPLGGVLRPAGHALQRLGPVPSFRAWRDSNRPDQDLL